MERRPPSGTTLTGTSGRGPRPPPLGRASNATTGTAKASSSPDGTDDEVRLRGWDADRSDRLHVAPERPFVPVVVPDVLLPRGRPRLDAQEDGAPPARRRGIPRTGRALW